MPDLSKQIETVESECDRLANALEYLGPDSLAEQRLKTMRAVLRTLRNVKIYAHHLATLGT